jgi:hypothetical protein
VATPAQIAAAITTATTQLPGGYALLDGIVALLDGAIAGLLVDSAQNGASAGPFVITTSSDGQTMTFATLTDMVSARDKYRMASLRLQGGQTSVAEFSPFGQGTNSASM